MKIIIFILVLLVIVVGCETDIKNQTENTYTTKEGYPAAINKHYIELAVEYATGHNHEALQKLIDQNIVFWLSPGKIVHITDGTFTGLVEIRPEGIQDTVWTMREALQ